MMVLILRRRINIQSVFVPPINSVGVLKDLRYELGCFRPIVDQWVIDLNGTAIDSRGKLLMKFVQDFGRVVWSLSPRPMV